MFNKIFHNTIFIVSFCFLSFIFLFDEAIKHIVSSWDTAEGAHGPLIIAVILYLIWLKKGDFKTLPIQPAILPGALLTSAGCFALFAGKLSSTMLLQQIAIVPFLLGMILLLCGWSYLRVLFLPVGYLIFITGIVETLLSSVAIYLQLSSAWIAVQFFKLIGMPVVLSRIIIELPHIALEVVRACSGISHLVAIMALSIPLGFMNKLTPIRKLFLVIASFFIGLLANGFRIFLIGVYALYNEGADLHGPNESLAVSVIFFFGMILLAILSHFLKKKNTDPSVAVVPTQIENEDVIQPVTEEPFTSPAVEAVPRSRYAAWAVAGVLLVITFCFANFYKISPTHLNNSLNNFPNVVGAVAARDMNWIDEQLRPFPADEEMVRLYSNSDGLGAEVYIGYFTEQSRTRKIIDWRRDWMHSESEKTTVDTSFGTVVINKTRLNNRFNPADIYFWYVMDDRIITSQYAGKFYTFLDGLLKRRTNGAVVVVQTRSSQEKVMPFLEELVPEILRHLGSGEWEKR